MADVFLSYSQKDRAIIERIAAGLKSLGLAVWYDARLDSGSSFDEVINAELTAAHAVLVCWSPNSIVSRWPRSEAMLAYDTRKLTACFIHPCQLTPPFNLIHTTNLADWNGEPAHAGWVSVARALGNLCKRPGVGALAEALATGAQDSISRWIAQYPNEPLAAEMWEARRAKFQTEFIADLAAARTALDDGLAARRQETETALLGSEADFANWLDANHLGKLATRPDPRAIVSRALQRASGPPPFAPSLPPAVEEKAAPLAPRPHDFDLNAAPASAAFKAAPLVSSDPTADAPPAGSTRSTRTPSRKWLYALAIGVAGGLISGLWLFLADDIGPASEKPTVGLLFGFGEGVAAACVAMAMFRPQSRAWRVIGVVVALAGLGVGGFFELNVGLRSPAIGVYFSLFWLLPSLIALLSLALGFLRTTRPGVAK